MNVSAVFSLIIIGGIGISWILPSEHVAITYNAFGIYDNLGT